MHLKEYLVKADVSIEDLANAIGYSAVYMRAVINGRCRPSKRLAVLIEQATKGAVSRMDVVSPKISKVPKLVNLFEEKKQDKPDNTTP